jgi:hypothetical protein
MGVAGEHPAPSSSTCRRPTSVRRCVNTAEPARCQAKSPRRLQLPERRRRAEASGVVTVTVVAGGYRAPPESLTVIARTANAASAAKLKTPARWFWGDSILKRLPQDLKHMACALRQRLEAEEAMRCQRHLHGRGHLAPTDQADVGAGVGWGATRPCGDAGGIAVGQAGDAVDACPQMITIRESLRSGISRGHSPRAYRRGWPGAVTAGVGGRRQDCKVLRNIYRCCGGR